MEENNDEVPAEETSDRGVCARALYDYQAGEGFFFFVVLFVFFSTKAIMVNQPKNGIKTILQSITEVNFPIGNLKVNHLNTAGVPMF